MSSSAKGRARNNRASKALGSPAPTAFVGGSSDNLSPTARRRAMSAVKGRNTAPELLVRRIAHGLGFRFRLSRADLPGRPDLVFPRLRCVIFVHGCFWHAHTCKKGRTEPAHNAEFWREKRRRNKLRDQRAVRLLKHQGWRVLTIWECQLKDIGCAAVKIEAFLRTSDLGEAKLEAGGHSELWISAGDRPGI
jgi:DNA mismatch endonuclease, patch repair protein